jgi:hypothetical protein
VSQTQTYGSLKKNIEWGRKMLRHIISVSLAMTACATLIPTKANAATLTVIPIGGLQRNPGDSITFIFSLNPAPSIGNVLRFTSFDYAWDGSELSFNREEFRAEIDSPINNTTTIGRVVFDVTAPVKDGGSDIFDAVAFTREGDEAIRTPSDSVVDVHPVPEPLSIFGTATALGCGVLFKRKSSKKTVS